MSCISACIGFCTQAVLRNPFTLSRREKKSPQSGKGLMPSDVRTSTGVCLNIRPGLYAAEEGQIC